MELKKRKYKRDQVSAIIDAYKEQYDNLILDLRSRINELVKENKGLLEKIEHNKQREKTIIATLERAEISAEQIKEQAQLEYVLELQRLRSFSARWDRYFNKLKEKYPVNNTTKKALEIIDQVNQTKDSDAKKTIQKIDDLISEENRSFNPKSKIKDYICATTSESGFNINEVLNPGKLELEDLCKELGLMEEDE